MFHGRRLCFATHFETGENVSLVLYYNFHQNGGQVPKECCLHVKHLPRFHSRLFCQCSLISTLICSLYSGWFSLFWQIEHLSCFAGYPCVHMLYDDVSLSSLSISHSWGSGTWVRLLWWDRQMLVCKRGRLIFGLDPWKAAREVGSCLILGLIIVPQGPVLSVLNSSNSPEL